MSCIIEYTLDNGTKMYVSNIHMRKREEAEIQLTDNIKSAKLFEKCTAENIVIMNWWKNIGTASVKHL